MHRKLAELLLLLPLPPTRACMPLCTLQRALPAPKPHHRTVTQRTIASPCACVRARRPGFEVVHRALAELLQNGEMDAAERAAAGCGCVIC